MTEDTQADLTVAYMAGFREAEKAAAERIRDLEDALQLAILRLSNAAALLERHGMHTADDDLRDNAQEARAQIAAAKETPGPRAVARVK